MVTLERIAGEAADLLVNGTPIARGEVVVIDDQYGLRIIEILDAAEAVQGGGGPDASETPAEAGTAAEAGAKDARDETSAARTTSSVTTGASAGRPARRAPSPVGYRSTARCPGWRFSRGWRDFQVNGNIEECGPGGRPRAECHTPTLPWVERE